MIGDQPALHGQFRIFLHFADLVRREVAGEIKLARAQPGDAGCDFGDFHEANRFQRRAAGPIAVVAFQQQFAVGAKPRKAIRAGATRRFGVGSPIPGLKPMPLGDDFTPASGEPAFEREIRCGIDQADNPVIDDFHRLQGRKMALGDLRDIGRQAGAKHMRAVAERHIFGSQPIAVMEGDAIAQREFHRGGGEAFPALRNAGHTLQPPLLVARNRRFQDRGHPAFGDVGTLLAQRFQHPGIADLLHRHGDAGAGIGLADGNAGQDGAGGGAGNHGAARNCHQAAIPMVSDRWQATARPSATICNGGVSVRQRAMATGQRG